eukprot:TRINITY_DN66002_c5_g4_i1.p1 TRINITY_DN66002_c5_g4~~TRINITY_DN66002_c5_g4_i1.p1  ORF type:complete len:126 (-),score=0.87 TRINITY_DN66002_c5_g4_i1:347-724(-)
MSTEPALVDVSEDNDSLLSMQRITGGDPSVNDDARVPTANEGVSGGLGDVSVCVRNLSDKDEEMGYRKLVLPNDVDVCQGIELLHAHLREYYKKTNKQDFKDIGQGRSFYSAKCSNQAMQPCFEK